MVETKASVDMKIFGNKVELKRTIILLGCD